MSEEYWKKWEEKGVIKDISKDLREDFSGAKVELKFEKKPSEEKKEEKEEKKTEEKKSSKGKTVFSGLLLGIGIFLISTLPYKVIIKGYFSTYYLMACILGIVLAGVGGYIMPKKQKGIAIGICIIMFIICVLVFSRAIVFIKQYI